MMNGEQWGSLAYLLVLGVLIAGWHVAANRHQMGKIAQHIAIWTFIFLGGIVAAGLWLDIRNDITPRQASFMDGARVEVPRAPDGHYYLTLRINDAPIRFVVDTGATEVVLSGQDAERIGFSLDTLMYTRSAVTANGVVQTAPVRLGKVDLAGIIDENVSAVVNSGALHESLLGMSYLSLFERIEISDGTLILER